MGVKSLWSLLMPVGRPVMLETMEGKIMAIDSSIWIYQFQATMRDKDGHVLMNAHVLGFLRRISKLLFYGIKPVFVFDGAAPTLKKTTLRERREKKSGASSNYVKLAEKLLAAQLRREALNHTQSSSQNISVSKNTELATPLTEYANTAYLEDIDSSKPKTPAKRAAPQPSPSKKDKFYDHDPYRLPEVDLEVIAKGTRSIAPDPRLATEDELRAFIEDMRPEDFDVTSPAFRELPTEVQYEIVGDLRLKSRQTSYARLQNMLENAPTPFDFSKQQIKNLRQRNTLTQQLLITTDSIGSAHISIPVRIASERNKEYVLTKNEGDGGGWILGIRDDGTEQKPIEIDHEDEKKTDDNDDDDSDDMEEVAISSTTVDPDLREYQQTMALSAIGNRSSKQATSMAARIVNRKKVLLFDYNGEDDDLNENLSPGDSSEDDGLLAIGIQASLDQALNESESNRSQAELSHSLNFSNTAHLSSGPCHPCSPTTPPRQEGNTFRPLESASSTSQTALRGQPLSSPQSTISSLFGRPSLLSNSVHPEAQRTKGKDFNKPSDNILESIALQPPFVRPQSSFTPWQDQMEPTPSDPGLSIPSSNPLGLKRTPSPVLRDISLQTAAMQGTSGPSEKTVSVTMNPIETEDRMDSSFLIENPFEKQPSRPSTPLVTVPQDSGDYIPWSRSPSPEDNLPSDSLFPPASPPQQHGWDAAEEMDLQAEESEYARFISQVKGKRIEDVRREIDDEIKLLNQQRKAAMRDSEDITQQMVNQIMAMLRLFGIPYITAPMEAEAQCAELVSIGLADGVITDDSDVFLFGAQRVYKNMFNQSKTVECFLLTDLSRELGLERDTLVQLAYLLGSDYVDGLPGVGPVIAMELLKEFSGKDGLHKFKDWWSKVQTGRDKADDNKSKFRKKFKKKFKDLYLAEEWPNPTVEDAYYHPVVDSSDEPFKWGLPDLDALRAFFREELGWGQGKVDEILLPIIQRMNKRRQATALNKQSNLNEFLNVSSGSGTYAPRKRQAYTSKRLQDVVKDFRQKRSRRSASPSLHSQSSSSDEGESTKKRKKTTAATKGNRKTRADQPTQKRKLSRGSRSSGFSRNKLTSDEHEEFRVTGEANPIDILPDPIAVARLRPRPRPAHQQTHGETAL